MEMRDVGAHSTSGHSFALYRVAAEFEIGIREENTFAGAKMNRIVFLSAVMALAGCAAQTEVAVYKLGASRATAQADYDDCKIASFKEIPQALATSVNPGFSSPGVTQCNTYGTYTTCQQVGAIEIPATARTRDANSDLRNRYDGRCMKAKGYDALSKPVCGTLEDSAKASKLLASGEPSGVTCVPHSYLQM